MNLLKRIISKLPGYFQNELKRMYYILRFKLGMFKAGEPEYDILHQFISLDDWVIDIGANIGHYTTRLSELVGEKGRVVAFEPVPKTFSLLTAIVQTIPYENISLINAAVSSNANVVGIKVPNLDHGLPNYYEAHVSELQNNTLQVITLSIDDLKLKHRIALVKIDVEGHEREVLSGMINVIKRDKPTLIIETQSEELKKYLEDIGYSSRKLKGSPNMLFTHSSK